MIWAILKEVQKVWENYSICEHKIILKPVYTIYDIQLLLQFQILIYVDP